MRVVAGNILLRGIVFSTTHESERESLLMLSIYGENTVTLVVSTGKMLRGVVRGEQRRHNFPTILRRLTKEANDV